MDPGAFFGAYPAELGLASLAWRRLPSSGSFSGAAVFAGGRFGEALHALKVWPGRADLGDSHRAVRTATAAGLDFVPELRAARNGATATSIGGRTAELMAWAPGSPSEAPTAGRLESLGASLAALHRAWAGAGPGVAATSIPAVERRLAELKAASDWPAWLAPLVADALRTLRPDTFAGARLHLTVGDCRLGHALFTGDRLTGLVDFGAAKVDHPASDLARLAQSLGAEDRARLVGAYRAAGGDADAALVDRLADTGLVAAACRWWRLDPSSVRLGELRARLTNPLPAVVFPVPSPPEGEG